MVKCLSAHNEPPYVSVITPSYNSIRFIGETILSVQNQSYENWEMLIVDDGSTDQSATKIKDIIEGDSRIRLLSLKQNVGAAKARNLAIKRRCDTFLSEKLRHCRTYSSTVNCHSKKSNDRVTP